MSEIERLAKAALANINEQAPAPYGPDDENPDPELWDDMRAHLDSIKVNDHFSLIDLTRAIVQELREPSQGMYMASYAVSPVPGITVGRIWRAIADHLLNE